MQVSIESITSNLSDSEAIDAIVAILHSKGNGSAILEELVNSGEIDVEEVFNNLSDGEKLLAEEEESGMGEKDLSHQFDEVIESMIDYPGFNDPIMINEDFNNWMDSVHGSDEIGDYQLNTYEYVGKYE